MSPRQARRKAASVTICDVARRAGVSITTVSNVIHGKANIPETTRRRVKEAINALDFAPNKLAQRLVTKKTETIALLVPTIENPFFAELYNGIERYIEERRGGYKTVIGHIGYSARKEAELIAAFRREFFDGYIVVSNDPSGVELGLLAKQGVPLVFAVNDPREVGLAPLSSYNNEEMAREAARHLAGLGHRRFGYIAGTFGGSSRAQARYRGFRACLEERGIPFDERCFVEGGAYTSRCGYESFRAFAGRGVSPTALFCANDVLAIGALRAIREAGLEIPRDISVVGYDDIPASEYLDPPLTTVSVQPSLIGYEAADLLFDAIDGRDLRCARRLTEGKLVVRASTAPPRCHASL